VTVSAADALAPGGAIVPARLCLVGAGRLARAFARRIDAGVDLIAVSRHRGRLSRPGTCPDLVVSDDPTVAAGAELVLLAVPAEQIPAAMRWLAPHLPAGTVVANLATELDTASVAPLLPGCQVIACKVVGQSGEIAAGAPAAIVVSGTTLEQTRLVAAALAGVGTVVAGAEQIAARVNETVARKMISGHLDLVGELERLELPDTVREAAIANLAIGILRAVSSGTAGPYLRKIMAELG
jgi:predicted dinucleotide-binding enzyme